MKKTAMNYFTIVGMKNLNIENYWRVILKHEYFLIEDTELILTFTESPNIGQKVILSLEDD